MRSSILDWLLSADPRQRSYILRYAIGAANCLGGLIALEIGARLGICPHTEVVHAIIVVGLLVELIFYVLLRSGINKRFADPSLTGYEYASGEPILTGGRFVSCR